MQMFLFKTPLLHTIMLLQQLVACWFSYVVLKMHKYSTVCNEDLQLRRWSRKCLWNACCLYADIQNTSIPVSRKKRKKSRCEISQFLRRRSYIYSRSVKSIAEWSNAKQNIAYGRKEDRKFYQSIKRGKRKKILRMQTQLLQVGFLNSYKFPMCHFLYMVVIGNLSKSEHAIPAKVSTKNRANRDVYLP